MNRLGLLLTTGLGTGYLPIAPGSWGSLAVTAIYLLLALVIGSHGGLVSAAMALLALLAGVACVLTGTSAERHFGKKDPSPVTIDEWAGQALTFVALPAATGWGDRLLVAGVALVLFRLFDIFKPPPADRLQELHGGWGILIDDLVAALYANAAAQLVLRLGLHATGVA